MTWRLQAKSDMSGFRFRHWAMTLVVSGFALGAASLAAHTEPATDVTNFAARYAAVDTPAASQARDAPPASVSEPLPARDQPSASSDPRARYRAAIEREASQAGLAPAIAEAVMAVESGYNPGAVGTSGE